MFGKLARIASSSRRITKSVKIYNSSAVRLIGLPISRSRNFRCMASIAHPRNTDKLAIDALILERTARKSEPIHLHDLVRWKNLKGHQPPLHDLLENARFVISEITTRLARRLDAMRDLPLIVELNPHVAEIYNIYYNSFNVMSQITPPKTAEENAYFVEILDSLVQLHSNTIPVLAQGFSQCVSILGKAALNKILWEHLQARIGTRILAEHHIALTKPIGSNFVGCIQTDLNPSKVCEQVSKTVAELTSLQFGFSPQLHIDLGQDVKLAYPPNHLEYILTELLKNSFRAVCSLGESVCDEYPVLVTVIKSGTGVIIRIRDRGGGIIPENESDVFQFSYTTVEREGEGLVEGVDSSLAGLGYGLPLSKAYAEFFGGKLQLQSYHGWGTDVYLTLKSPMISGYYRDIL